MGISGNNEWRLVEIDLSIASVCNVKSETIKLNMRVDLRCTRTSFMREEILSCILQVSLEYVSCVSGYDTSTLYHSDSLSIPG